MLYLDNNEVLVGDRILHHGVSGVVEEVIEGDEVAENDLDSAGFLIVCGECGRVLINPGTADWEDVEFDGRSAG